MTSLTKRLMGKGTGQVMEYGEESVHNVLKSAQNAIIFVAKKFKDNVLHVMTAMVNVLQSTAPQNPVASPPCALLRVPNALIIK